ncbi:MAG: hypothetical protein FWB85_03550 [Chitinispirillia bacterium]|nr:hypothetical protein [Chitinispirillia bacterium]
MAIIHRRNGARSRVLRSILRTDTSGADITVTPSPACAANRAVNNAPAYTLPSDIPKSYDDTYARAIPKDPQNTFLYWERPREVTRECVFPDKGTAHVGNHEVDRVQQQLGQDWYNNRHNGNNSQWLSDNGHWLNNTKQWHSGGQSLHGGNDHGSGGNNHAAFGNFTAMIDNLIGQCKQFIEDHKHHKYSPAPSSGEIYKVNEGAQG